MPDGDGFIFSAAVLSLMKSHGDPRISTSPDMSGFYPAMFVDALGNADKITCQ